MGNAEGSGNEENAGHEPRKARLPQKQKTDGRITKRAFLSAFVASGGRLGKAAEVCGINRSNHYEWMKIPSYAAAFEEAWRQAAEVIEEEAIRRAREGVQRPVLYHGEIVRVLKDPSNPKSELVPLMETEFSDTLMATVLKARMPEKYRENSTIEHTGAGGGPIETRITVRFVKPGEGTSEGTSEGTLPEGKPGDYDWRG